MKKLITGKMEYVLWQCRKLKEDQWTFISTGKTIYGKCFCIIKMTETNWTKW